MDMRSKNVEQIARAELDRIAVRYELTANEL